MCVRFQKLGPNLLTPSVKLFFTFGVQDGLPYVTQAIANVSSFLSNTQ